MQTTLDELSIIQPGIPVKDGCRVLRRIKTFLTQAGVASTLEYTFRDAYGNPINLAPTLAESESQAVGDEPADQVLLKVQEFTAIGVGCQTPIIPVEGVIADPVNGVVRARLPKPVTFQSGLYRLSWGFIRDCELRVAQEGLLSVERSLWGVGPNGTIGDGPPTINELRMMIADSDPAENVLLDDVEFSDDQIVLALVKPIQYFNEALPPLGRLFDTRDFPWKSHWLDAAIGHLHEIAAAKYRRNKLNVAAGGMSINDLDREREYLTQAARREADWKTFTASKKLELNMQQCVGGVGSTYGGRHW